MCTGGRGAQREVQRATEELQRRQSLTNTNSETTWRRWLVEDNESATSDGEHTCAELVYRIRRKHRSRKPMNGNHVPKPIERYQMGSTQLATLDVKGNAQTIGTRIRRHETQATFA